MSAPPSPDANGKRGFKLQAKRPFFVRRGGSTQSQSSNSSSSQLSKHLQSPPSSPSLNNLSTHGLSSSVSSADTPTSSNTVRWKDHPGGADEVGRAADQDSDSYSGMQKTSRDTATPLSGSAFFAAAATTPTPTLSTQQVSISSLHFVQTLNGLLLEPASLALTQLAPPSVLAVPWQDSPYGRNLDAPSSTSLSTYISSGSADPASPAAHQVYGCNEQLAASAISLPSVSVAALWRMTACMQWINDNADAYCQALAPTEPASYLDARNSTLTTPPLWNPNRPVIFEIGGFLQTLMDALSSAAAHHGIELVLFHGNDPSAEVFAHGELRPEGGLRELHCRGDDAGLGTAIMAIICKIMQQSRSGDTIEVGLSLACLATSPNYDDIEESRLFSQRPESIHSTFEEDEEESTPWEATLDIAHCCGPSADALAEPSDPLVRDPLIGMLGKGLGIRIGAIRHERRTRRSWPVTMALQQTVPPPPRPEPPSNQSQTERLACRAHQRAIKLIRFAETFLRGKKAMVYSAEQSLFAKHLTGYLAMWGLHPTHVPLESSACPDESQESFGSSKQAESTSSESDHSHLAPPRSGGTPHSPEPHAPSTLDASVNFIFIDDDISTLRRQLILIKNSMPQLQLPGTLLNKRPGLSSRRTRSSAQVRPQSTTNIHITVIYFASLSKFRFIREIVQSIFRGYHPVFTLPEVFVLPKPAGPRRLLTSLHTALKKPFLDPTVAPIATSPSSPGGHFFYSGSSRPSPAPSSHQDFDAAFGAHAHAAAAEQTGAFASPKTPPYHSAPLGQSSDPPSPRTSSSEAVEFIEYLSKTNKDLGTNVNTGIMMTGIDGKPQGLFFQPKRGASSPSGNPTSISARLAPDATGHAADLTQRRSDEDLADMTTEPASPTAEMHLSEDGVLDGTLANVPKRSSIESTFSVPVNSPSKPSRSSPEPPTVDSLPSLPAIMSHQLASGGPLTRQAPAIMSPALESAGRAMPLDTFMPVVAPHAHRSLSDTLATTGSMLHTANLAAPPLSRMTTAPANVSLATANAAAAPASSSNLGSGNATKSPPIGRVSPSAPQETSAASTPISKPSLSPTATTAGSLSLNQKEGAVSPISGSPAAILAKSANRKPRGEIGKSKRRTTNPVVPPVNVLIVEDNRIEQIVVSTFLRRHGIRCSVAANGQEAVDKWKTGGFHLVLMDIQLPVKSGIEATMEIRELERANNIAAFQMTPTSEGPQPNISAAPTPVTSPHQLPVIIVALTASSLSADRISALAAGCNDFITKPVSHKWLHQKVLEWGSMSYLSSFKRIKTPATSFTAPGPSHAQASASFDRTAAQKHAQEIAASLHIERRPRESASRESAELRA